MNELTKIFKQIRQLIRADGTKLDLPNARSIEQHRKMLNANTLDTVTLHHMGQPRHVMLIDDIGHDKKLPVNAEATRLYHANCSPGTTHTIRGDVIVAPDADFA
ncbi:hypothetical protein BH10PSE16_BH10PSE16_01360 [soil metagenome]